MATGSVEGIERAVFGPVTHQQVDAWLCEHVHTRLGCEVDQVLFRSGRVAAVYGLRLGAAGGGVVAGPGGGLRRRAFEVVVKVHRGRPDTAALGAAVTCQRVLAEAGFPCPVPVDGPASTGGLTAVIDSLLPPGRRGDARQPAVRAALATGLVQHVDLLRASPAAAAAAAGLSDPPAWARWQQGPWPAPHDPILDFTTTPTGWAWLDDVAAQATTTLAATSRACGPPGVGHSDWSCVNVTFAEDAEGTAGASSEAQAVVAAYDWDSLVVDTEAALLGMTAGSYTQGGTNGPQAPSPRDVAAFLADYESACGATLSAAERTVAAAAATWVLAYNARCELALLPPGRGPVDGSSLAALTAHRQDYQRLGR